MKSLLSKQQRLLLPLVVGVVAAALVWSVRTVGWLQSVQLWQYDMTTSALATAEPVSDVKLVALNDRDLGRWGWPLSDAQVAILVRAALDGGARVVGIDFYRDTTVGEGEETLLALLSDPRVVVISRLPNQDGQSVQAPAGAQTGFADVPIDPDGVARRALLLVNTDEGLEVSFPLKLAMLFTGESDLRPAPDNPRVLGFGASAVPPLSESSDPYTQIDASGYQVLARYRNAPPLVRHVSAQALLDRTADVANQLVILGMASDTVKDYFSTPLNRLTGAEFTFGAEVHAAITQQLIDYTNGNLEPFLRMPQTASSIVILLLAVAGAGCAVLWPARLVSLLVGVGGAAILMVGLAVTQRYGLLLPVAPFTLAWASGFVMTFVIVTQIARRHRHIMADLFASQLSEELSAEIWRQRDNLLNGRKPVSSKLFVTVLLADIEGSTSIGRDMPADAFMAWISRLLDALSQVAHQHGGFVEKFTGDGILVVFGAPVPSTTDQASRRDARAALACAKEMQQVVRSLNAKNNGPAYGLRIGLNSGEVIAGTLGVPGAMRYNVIGDTVNVAARVEGLIKSFDPDENGARPIAMTEDTSKLLPDGSFSRANRDLRHDDGNTIIRIHLAK